MGLAATFGWLCVETYAVSVNLNTPLQPPSGGCVLKLARFLSLSILPMAATFGWLCVETNRYAIESKVLGNAATFGWLCVETPLGLC